MVETCECICFIVVAYSDCGKSSKCKKVQRFDDCIVGELQAEVTQNDCKGFAVRWECGACCDHVDVYVNRQLVESVDCEVGGFRSQAIPCAADIRLVCVGDCGESDPLVLVDGDEVSLPVANAAYWKK